MAKIKLITNVGDYGLFRGLARTRGRLITSTLVALAITYGVGLWSAHYILEISGSVVLNLVLITAMMMLVLVASYLVAVLVGDLFFPGPWREQVILGREDTARATVADHSAEFLIIVLIAVVINALAINLIAGDFLTRYHEEGFFRARLRADAPSERLAALEEIADPMSVDLWEKPAVQQTVVSAFDDPAAEVRARAYWTAGHIEVLEAADPLIAVIRDDQASATERTEAAVGLGKMGQQDRARQALEAVLAETDDPAVAVAMLRGLGLMAAESSVAPVAAELAHDDEAVRIHALWALRKIGASSARPHVRPLLEETEGQERCAAYDAMKLVATKEDVLWARKMYARSSAEETCDQTIWEDHDGEKYYIVYGDSYREKLLKTIANTAAFEHEDFFQRVVNDPAEPWRIREVASEVLRQIREAR